MQRTAGPGIKVAGPMTAGVTVTVFLITGDMGPPPRVKHVCTRIVRENVVQTCLCTLANMHPGIAPGGANAHRLVGWR